MFSHFISSGEENPFEGICSISQNFGRNKSRLISEEAKNVFEVELLTVPDTLPIKTQPKVVSRAVG